MNQVTKLGEQVAITGSNGGFSVTPQTLNDIVEFAKFMSLSSAGIPSYLRGNAPDCAAITMQALKWNFDPFSVAQKSYKVKDVLAYEAQLVAAVVNTRSGIQGRLKYSYEGEGDSLTCTVTGILDGEEYSYTSPRVGQITTKNSPLWKTDPQQQLGYYSARSWARRYTPEVLLGVYDRDEVEEFRGPENAKDVTPQPTVMQRLLQNATQEPTGEREGFNESFVHSETSGALNGDIIETNTNSGSSPSLEPDADDNAPSSSAEGSEPPSSDPSTNPERDLLIRYAKDVLHLAASKGTTGAVLAAIEKGYAADEFHKLSDDGRDKAKSISRSMRAIFNNETSLQSALDFFSDVLECSVEDLGGVDG